MTADIKDFYCGTPVTDYECGDLPFDQIPDEIIQQCKLESVNGKVYFEIRKGMPGLKQAGVIAHDRLAKHLSKHGCKQCRFTPSLWRHEHLPVSFTLVVDDLGAKYVEKNAAQHLLDTLKQQYEMSEDWSGSNYLGLELK